MSNQAETKRTAQSVFATLSALDVSEHVETKKGGGVELSYLSWAWAWHIVKQHFPTAFYTIYETPDGCIYWSDGRTCWVKTGVTIEGLEHIEYLPVMDHRNQSIPLERVTSFDVNKAIQRSLTKAAARHGLGLYIYAGEDLPLSDAQAKERAETAPIATKSAPTRKSSPKAGNVAKTPENVQNAPAALAPAAPAPAGFTPMEPEKYDLFVAGYAQGKKMRSGADIRESYQKQTGAGPAEMKAFDDDVFRYQLANNIQPSTNNA